jgi:hypothetical protein
MIQVPPASGAESSTVTSTREASLIESGVATEARESCIGHHGSYEDGLRGVSSGDHTVRPLSAMGGTGLEAACKWARRRRFFGLKARPLPSRRRRTRVAAPIPAAWVASAASDVDEDTARRMVAEINSREGLSIDYD